MTIQELLLWAARTGCRIEIGCMPKSTPDDTSNPIGIAITSEAGDRTEASVHIEPPKAGEPMLTDEYIGAQLGGAQQSLLTYVRRNPPLALTP